MFCSNRLNSGLLYHVFPSGVNCDRCKRRVRDDPIGSEACHINQKDLGLDEFRGIFGIMVGHWTGSHER